MISQNAIDTLKRLVAYPSVSSTSNADVSQFASDHLESLGFVVEQTRYEDPRGVSKVNLVARRDPRSPSNENGANELGANDQGGLSYFCHTDVVPAVGWTGPGDDPFDAVVREDRIFGRGSCDMKGSLVAMLEAVSRVNVIEQRAPIWIVCTADEEVGFAGAKQLVNESSAYRQIVQAQPLAIIGEPTQLEVVHAHKGVRAFQVISRGRAAHSSSTDGINANKAMVPLLQTLLDLHQKTQAAEYQDDRFDPPVLSWNFGVSDGATAVNITPEKSVAWVMLRPMPTIDGEDLVQTVRQKANELGLEFRDLDGGDSFWTEPNANCVQEICKIVGKPAKTVCYGTDGGEFKELENRVVLGPGSIAQAHTTDEWIELDQLEKGSDVYEQAIRRWCT